MTFYQLIHLVILTLSKCISGNNFRTELAVFLDCTSSDSADNALLVTSHVQQPNSPTIATA